MGKWTSEILAPENASGEDGHIPDEDLARLAEGNVSAEERPPLVAHMNRCRECYRTFEATLRDIEPAKKHHFWETGKVVAMAASFIVVILSSVLYYDFQQGASPHMLQATLAMDSELRLNLVDNNVAQWDTGERIDRLAELLKRRGVKIGALKQVVITKPYYPTKSIFPPKESLKVRIENGVAYLEVVEATAKDGNSTTQ